MTINETTTGQCKDMNMIYICKNDDEDESYPALREAIYIREIDQVTTLNRRSLSGGPKGTAIP